MAPKRPHSPVPEAHPHSPASSSTESPPKRVRTGSPMSASPNSVTAETVRIYIIQAKMDPQTISELFSLTESYKSRGKGGRVQVTLKICSDVHDADIIITAVHMKKRLERHVEWELAKQKAIVTPQWLRDSVQNNELLACEAYAALQELQGDTAASISDHADKRDNPSELQTCISPVPGLSSSVHNTSKDKLSYTSRYACARACPVICPNQALVGQLETLRRSRELEGENMNALSYERAISVVKAYPHIINSRNLHAEVINLPGIGKKMFSKIEQYATQGEINESRATLDCPRFQALSAFTSVYGIGPTTARKLYDLGLRTIEHLEKYYGADDTDSKAPTTLVIDKHVLQPPPEISIKVGLALRKDFNETIPRAEVEEMHAVIMQELDQIQEGCISTIAGGYRRGKTESNDVDIVITHSNLNSGGEKVKGLCEKLVRRLYDRGLLTHIMHLSSFRPHDALRTAHWDSLEKALTVFVFPSDGTRRRIHRRLDLIFAAPEAYWTAVTGWTGSKMFERDLRLWAKEKRGLKFDSSGITRRHDSKPFFPKSEEDVFDILGLAWVDPTLRNA